MAAANELEQKLNEAIYYRKVLNEKTLQLEFDIQEHKDALSILEGTDKERPCFKLINHVLIEKPAGEVANYVKVDIEQMSNMHAKLLKELDDKSTQINKIVAEINSQKKN